MRIAVLAPAFHGYYLSLANGLRELGHHVTAAAYDAREGAGEVVAAKLLLDVPERFGRDTTARHRRRDSNRARTLIDDGHRDVLLVVKGDTVDPALVAQARRRGTRTVLYLWDELRRTRHDWADLAVYDHIAAYSQNDLEVLHAHGFSTSLAPGAYDPRLGWRPMPTEPDEPEVDLLFIGARYGRRAEMLQTAAGAGLRVRAYGRDWSRHPVDRLRSLTWQRPPIPAGRDVPLTQTVPMVAGAVAVLNVHHDQDGFTMRTFEIPGMGGLQVIDRSDVAQFYTPGDEVLVFADADELVDIVRAAKADPAWAASVRAAGRERTLAEHTFVHRCAELVP